ncbi:MAG: 16S rRNA (uracil(1498)-N(3))-methyltransferase [Betaproteobacteria bacterium RBG_16_64_18]|nr:MAG: 16S rRNA (uracil(1498)-N(3))-methyltransferase [Betaproteobacteria bacterium RBG_16_64_18]OGA07847.1 MAG: 16S rRNA (uracil(1498)-N(3))-methyltransferase [Betaproteobacteria bacterium RIFCSPLOWO2_02_FULL_65_20]
MLEFPSSAAPRFFVDGPLAPGAEVDLADRVVRHVAVLRLRIGDPLTLFDGSGGEYEGTLSRVTRNAVRARVLAWRDLERESGIQITLAQGLCASDRMDFAMQKATELGVRAIRPLATERSLVRLSEERADRRLAHWRNVVTAACEQCGRNRLPEVHAVATLGEFLSGAHADAQRLLLSPSGAVRLRELAPADRVIVLIGPEGGLSEDEQGRVRMAGFTAVRIGPRVLRTETAPLAAIAALQAMWGDV